MKNVIHPLDAFDAESEYMERIEYLDDDCLREEYDIANTFNGGDEYIENEMIKRGFINESTGEVI